RVEYPSLTFLTLPSYNIRYGDQKQGMVKAVFKQVPTILKAIYQEHRQLQQIIAQHNIDLVLSDNRFGCWASTPDVPAIFMTHQIFILPPPKFQWTAPFIHWVNRWFINRYQQCWIPDYESLDARLSEKLVHLHSLPKEQFRFIGALSRFKKNIPVPSFDYTDILVVISGPEPQRSIFEAIVLEQIQQPFFQDKKILVVSGITNHQTQQTLHGNPNHQSISFLTALALNRKLLGTQVVVSRSGYSTIMDLVKLGLSAILVPTPEQTEQEYLAAYFKAKGWFYTISQTEFDLQKAMTELPNYQLSQSTMANRVNLLSKEVERWVEK
ncbi:MAG: glycosyltransferase, partial [Chitinophagales bacterium]